MVHFAANGCIPLTDNCEVSDAAPESKERDGGGDGLGGEDEAKAAEQADAALPAIETLEAADAFLAAHPNSAIPYFSRAAIYEKQGNMREALFNVDLALEKDGSHVPSLCLRCVNCGK